MAVTETIILDRTDGSWRSIVLTGDYTQIAHMVGNVKVRLGISSDSEGILLEPGDIFQAAETIYVKPTWDYTMSGRNKKVYLYINRV